MHRESGLHEHADESRRKRASSAARSSNTLALLRKTRACENRYT